MRIFIALALPKEIKTEIERIQKELKKTGVQARWVKPEITHLTLAFLGSISSEKIDSIGKILKKTAGQIKPLRLSLNQISCFPKPSQPRIVLADLKGDLGKLNGLAAEIRKGLKKEKVFFDQKPFKTHITLGRIKKRQNLKEIIKKMKVKKQGFFAEKVILFESTLTQTGPVYHSLKEVSLKKASSVTP
jgi:2'-5' RNA ligase